MVLDIKRCAKKNNMNVGERWSHIAVEPINACHPTLIDLYFMHQLSFYPARTGVLPERGGKCGVSAFE